MELRKLNNLPAEFRRAASAAIATAIEDGSLDSVAGVIRQAHQDEYWSASISADDATEYVLWLLVKEACSGRLNQVFSEKFALLLASYPKDSV